MLENYMGIKKILAEPEVKDGVKGYKVVYPDGYVSWSPQDVFEKAYMPLDQSNFITEPMVEDFIKTTEAKTDYVGSKPITVVHVELRNGMIISESTTCVDPKNYDENIGKQICLRKIKDKVWFGLGFMLQSAIGGVR